MMYCRIADPGWRGVMRIGNTRGALPAGSWPDRSGRGAMRSIDIARRFPDPPRIVAA